MVINHACLSKTTTNQIDGELFHTSHILLSYTIFDSGRKVCFPSSDYFMFPCLVSCVSLSRKHGISQEKYLYFFLFYQGWSALRLSNHAHWWRNNDPCLELYCVRVKDFDSRKSLDMIRSTGFCWPVYNCAQINLRISSLETFLVVVDWDFRSKHFILAKLSAQRLYDTFQLLSVISLIYRPLSLSRTLH